MQTDVLDVLLRTRTNGNYHVADARGIARITGEGKKVKRVSDLIDRQDAIDTLLTGKEFLMRVLDDADVVGQDREKYSWGLGLIESCINDIEELTSAEPEIIRCKDCKWHRGQYHCLNTDTYGYGLDDFCSLAERRGKEDE